MLTPPENWCLKSKPSRPPNRLPGGVKQAYSQALVTTLSLEHGALSYLCIMYWFGGTSPGCKAKIKKLGINFFFFFLSFLGAGGSNPSLFHRVGTHLVEGKKPHGLWIIDFSLRTEKGMCSQYFPVSSDRAAAFLSTPSKVTARSRLGSARQHLAAPARCTLWCSLPLLKPLVFFL